MNNWYSLGLGNLKVSLAVRVIDSYTGKPAKGRIFVKLADAKPIIKPDGYHVFTNLPENCREVTAGGDMFFDECVEVSAEPGNLAVDIYLTPNRRYKIPAGSAFVLKSFVDSELGILGCPRSGCVRLLEQGRGHIETDCRNISLEGRALAFITGDGISERFIAGKWLGGGKYALASELSGGYSAGTPLYPISYGRTDENGRLFMPFWGVGSKETNVALYTLDNMFFDNAELFGSMRVGGALPMSTG